MPGASIECLDTGLGYLFAGGMYGLYRRPLSDLSAVKEVPSSEQIAAQAYPNPFPTSTTIHFTASAPGFARVSVVNLLGVEVARLFEGELSAGAHSFTWNAADASAGTYFCLIRKASGSEQVVSIKHE